MRRDIREFREKRQIKEINHPSLPVLQRPETQNFQRDETKRLGFHNRVSTRLANQQLINKTAYNSMQTPNSYLPQVQYVNQKSNRDQKRSGIDVLQEHLHFMLLKNLKSFKENRNQKSLELDIKKKRQKMQENQKNSKKQNEKNRVQLLRQKLNQLYGELSLEERKLKIEYELQEKEKQRNNEYFNKIARRFQKNETVETGQNTEWPIILKKKQSETLQKKGGKALSKFRVAAFVVYFSLFFPKYSRCFAKIRREDFIAKTYEEKVIENSIQECYKLFEIINIRNFLKQISKKSIQDEKESVPIITSQSELINQQFIQNFQLEKIHSLLAFVLSNIFTAIKAGKLDNFIKEIGPYFSNRSYLADSLFLKSELFEIKSNQQAKMDLSANQQKMLLVNFLLSKLTAFSFMMNNSYISDNSIKYIFSKQRNNIFDNLSLTVARQLLVCGIYLINLCNQLNQKSKKIQDMQTGNLQQLNMDCLPLPMQQIELKSKVMIRRLDSKQQLNKRISIQARVQQFDNEYQGIYVKGTKIISDLFQNYRENSQRKEQFLSLIADIRDQIHDKMIKFKKQAYRAYSEAAIRNIHKISKGIDRNLTVCNERSEIQYQRITSLCNDFRTKRNKKALSKLKTHQQLDQERIQKEEQDVTNSQSSLSS